MPVEPVVSVEVDLAGVEGAVGILVKVSDGQPTTVDQELGQGPQQSVQVLHVVQRHGAPHHVVGPIEPVYGQVCLDSAHSVAEPGRLDPLPGDLHHPGGRIGHDDRAHQVGEQDAQPTGATTDVNNAHPSTEVHGLLDGLGHGNLPLLVAGVVVPGRCLVVEPLVFVHVLDPSPGAAIRAAAGGGVTHKLGESALPRPARRSKPSRSVPTTTLDSC
jgi:hypothetical protein